MNSVWALDHAMIRLAATPSVSDRVFCMDKCPASWAALLLVEHAGELVDVGKRIGPVLKADRKVSAVDRYDQL